MKIGLTGGYATGKSFVAAEFEKLGCFIVHADKLGYLVLQPDGEAYARVVEAFGSQVQKQDGSIDRRRLAQLVFHSPERLAELNRYVHPAVFKLEDQLLGQHAQNNPHGIAIVEAAILIETGRYSQFDRLILTDCREGLQIERAIARDSVDEEQVRARIKMQMPSAEKRAFADYIVETGGSRLETQQQVEKIFHELRELA